jgi:predicted cupin superfamily sugar epimerase
LAGILLLVEDVDGTYSDEFAGYFAETVRAEETIQTPFVAPENDGEKRGRRVLGTTIYYLLTAESHDNFAHMNKSTVRVGLLRVIG